VSLPPASPGAEGPPQRPPDAARRRLAPKRWACSLLLVGAAALGQSEAPAAARIVLRWREVVGASAYELQIAKDASFVEVVLQTRATTAFYRWESLPSSTHWWRVRSVDGEGRASEWSPPRTVAVDSVVPELKRPAAGASLTCGAPVQVELTASPLVKTYVLQLATTAAFLNPTVLEQPSPVFALGAPGVGTWHLRVLAVDLKGKRVGPGPARSFTVRVGSPKVKSVPESVLGAPPLQLAWSEVACARSWILEATNDGKDRAALTSTQPQTSFKATVAGEYRWRVAGLDEHGSAGEWSPESLFRVRLPAPQPKGEVVVTSKAELSWAPVPTAVGYRVELFRPGTGDEPQVLTVAAPPFHTQDLEAGSWTWRVSARDARGHLSAWSEPRSFERKPFAPLPTPVLRESPEVVAVGGAAALEWAAVSLATRYQLELDGQALALLEGTRFSSPPLSEGWHRLRVRALAPPLRESAWSEVREVYAGLVPVASARVELDGRDVQVRLFDKHGHRVPGAPTLSVTRGALGPARLEENVWVAAWTLPGVGDDVLLVEDRDFRLAHPLPRPLPTPYWAAFAAGGLFNGGAVKSPMGLVALGFRLPYFSRRLGLEARVSLFQASSTARFVGTDYRASAWLVPISVLVNWQQELGRFVLRGALGPSLLGVVASVNDASALQLVPGLELAASLSHPLGPGRLELELGFTWGRVNDALLRLQAGGVGVRLGYAFDFSL
jgi:hypothetical protein